MQTSAFFKIFPPPKFLEMPYAGLDISDAAVRCLMYRHTAHGLVLDRWGMRDIPAGTISAGLIKDADGLSRIIASLAGELKVTYVRASLPEERMYLFKTEVPAARPAEIRENIELRLEENVPLSPSDAVFYFDLIRNAAPRDHYTASVSVAPRLLVEAYRDVLEKARLVPVAFEVVPKSLARAAVRSSDTDTKLIVHFMDGKTGLYIVDEGVVLFTSTIPWGIPADGTGGFGTLRAEISKVFAYWAERSPTGERISEILLSGKGALAAEKGLPQGAERLPPPRVANVWSNAFSFDRYVPPLSHEESLGYAVAAGLALSY